MNRSNLEVVFRYPSEFDLVFPYLEKQQLVLEQQGSKMMAYELQFGEHEIVVNYTMTEEDWENPLGLNDGD